MALVTETQCFPAEVVQDVRFDMILQKNHFFRAPQARAQFLMFPNRSRQIALFIEQATQLGIVKVSVKSIIHGNPDDHVMDIRECSSVMAALQAVYDFCQEYGDWDYFNRFNKI